MDRISKTIAMKDLVYLNGEFVKRENAKISPDDRGFLFADGVYEVIKYYNGVAFQFDEHLKRLERSLSEIGIAYPETAGLKSVFQKLIDINAKQNKHAGVYLQISRGAHKRVHHFPKNILPTVYAYAFDLPSATEKLEKGIKVITHEDIRWQRCDIKSVSLLPNTLLFNKAVERDAGECVLIRNGEVTEATHSSVFGVKNGRVYTHPNSELILPGITRKVIIEICEDNNIEFLERAIKQDELCYLDELFIAGTGSEVTPVVQINEKNIADKKPGPITRLIQQEFFEMTQQ